MGKKRKVDWKSVALPASLISKGIEGLVGIEELCDYNITNNEIVTSASTPKKRKVIDAENSKKKDSFGSSRYSGSWVVTPVKTRESNKQNHTKVPKKDFAERKKKIQGLKKHPNIFPLKVDWNKNKGKKKKKNLDSASNIATNVSICADKIYKNSDCEHTPPHPLGMEAWSALEISPPILKALSDLGFKKPTQIQELTLPAAIMGRRDILGAAETGSGKTLAFGIPIIYGILQQKKKNACSEEQQKFKNRNECSVDEMQTKVIDNTINLREISETSNDVESDAESIDSQDNETVSCSFGRKLYALILTPTRELAIQVHNHLVAVAKYTDIKIAVIVGGLAPQKQERILKKRPEIVVATPGRLWELIENGNPHLERVSDISFLAIDETDRMLEKGHFQELQTLLQSINKDEYKKRKRQNFVFSATLTMVHEPPKYVKKHKTPQQITPGQKLQSIISSLGITNPKVVDITLEKGTASKLSEARIVCSLTEKDYYLYYFILRHTGRTLVFCNSISCVRRLALILEILQCKPYQLHANMQQRQRLKNLERFRDDPSGLLLATDVAARGLDIPNVQHVIHYQVPRTSESYVHRSGRTARAQREGITVLIMEPDEVPFYLRLCTNLGRDRDLPDFPVDDDLLLAAKSRVQLALQIDKLEHTLRRSNSKHGWFQKAAKEMDMLLDEDVPSKMSDEASAQLRNQINGLRKQLKNLIGTTILPKNISVKFPNQSVRKSNHSSAIAVANEKNKKLGAFVKIRK